MAVALDAKMTGGNGTGGFNQQATGATSINSTGITVGASANLLVVTVVWEGSGAGHAPSGITMKWNGGAMTLGPTVTVNTQTTATIYYLLSPTAGAKTIAGAWSESCDCYLGAVSFTGADGSTPVVVADNTTKTGATEINVTSDTVGATCAVFVTTDGGDPTVTQTELWSTAPFNPGGGASYALGGTTNTHGFSGAGGSSQALAGIHILGTGGGGATVKPRSLLTLGAGC